MDLLTSIRTQILQEGAIPFVEFMQQALYAPSLGYYSAGLQKLGTQGDFITAPELTPLFGQTLANQCQQVLTTMTNPILFEFGAGSGRLCVDLLRQLEHSQCLPKAYHIMEVSSNLRQRQLTLMQQEIPHLLDRITWLERWPTKPFQGIIIANEVLDAMPVHRFLKTKEDLLESFITVNEEQELIEIFKPCTNNQLIVHVQRCLPSIQNPYQSEANLFIDNWLQQCYTMLTQGTVFLLDYGFPRHEYYHPERHTGTLMCHSNHQAHTNPLIHVGEQDITAHVDFTHVAEAAYTAGFQIAGYTNQASFLLANGLLSLVDKLTIDRNRIMAQQAIKQLLQPHEMGELFKVIALSKKIDLPLTGFQLHDKRANL